MTETKYGVWCVDEGCFYDPTPRDWDDAVTETAKTCNTHVHHQFEVRPLEAAAPPSS
jgi:hypothetical protein